VYFYPEWLLNFVLYQYVLSPKQASDFMKQRLLLIAVLTAFYLQCDAQDQYELRKSDSLRIDSLKKLLPSLKGSARVDCMALICKHYFYVTPVEGFKFRNDSIRFYATKAQEEANKIGYASGFAITSIFLSGMEAVQGSQVTDEATKELNIRKAIKIAEENKNDEILGWGYYYLAGFPSIKNDFETYKLYSKKAIHHFLNSGNTLQAAEVSTWLFMEYSDRAEYEEAFHYGKSGFELLEKEDPEFASWQKALLIMSSECMAELYVTAGDYEAAMQQMRIANYGPHSFAWTFLEMGQFDSALVYYNRWRNDPFLFINTNSVHRAYQYRIMAKIDLKNRDFDKAIELLRSCIDTLKQHMNPPRNWKPNGSHWRLMSEAFAGKQQYKTALIFAKEGLHLAQNIKVPREVMDGYQQLSSVYRQLGINDSAYEYLLKYTIIKDSIENKKQLLRLNNNLYKYKKEADDARKQAEIGFLNRDNQIKKQQLKQEATTKKFLVALFIAAVLVGLYAYRNLALKRKNEKQLWTVQRLESEKKEAELKRQASDLQMQALRAQMNPHFIFNSLSSINWFIMENEKERASDYLTRFSRLMRMVLNAQKPAISLEDELKMLELYLDMERMRLEYIFDYSVTYTNAVDAGTISIPPMLLQPFCENAIWHGFANKPPDPNGIPVQGHLNINIRSDNNIIEFTITDNGIGRKEAAILTSTSVKKQKSKGLAITRERLALFSQENNADAGFEIADLADENGNAAGTRVIIKIGYREFIEEVA